MQWFLIIFYLIICVFLVGVVLMQRGKDSSGDLFGAGASSVLTGQGTTSFLVKLTATLSVLFFVLSFFLGVVINQSAERLRRDDVLKAKEAIAIESNQSVDAGATSGGISEAAAVAPVLEKTKTAQAKAHKSVKQKGTKHEKQSSKCVQSAKKVAKVATS